MHQGLCLYTKGCGDMKFIVKIKTTLYALCAGVLAIIILLTCTESSKSDILDAYFKDYIKVDSYKNINIYDCNGDAIYMGGFSDDVDLRLATFHLVGDKNGSVVDSILTKTSSEVQSFNKITGYTPKSVNISLTIDSKLQKGAYTLLSNYGYKGCIIVSDYSTGAIKALVSTPSVDVYNTDYIEDGAFLNKAVMTYPPGSVFKAVTVAAMLEHNSSAKSFSYHCTGKARHISCFNNTPHGTQPLSEVLSNSCNCGISMAANTYLTANDLNSFSEKSGITSKSIVADMNILEGSIDSADDLMWSANGQSKNMVTPLNVVSYYNAIANGGIRNTLFLFSDVQKSKSTQIMSKNTAEYILTSLNAVTVNYGINYNCFGKTGTAELDDAESHAWFVCCLQDDNAPTYTILVFLEHGGLSSAAKALSKEYINNYILG